MRNIDGKFATDGSRIFNRVSHEEIPDDEPLFLLRARDAHAVFALGEYLAVCSSKGCNEQHLTGIHQVLSKFARFKVDHPERMKEPGVTRHLRLEGDDAEPGQPIR